MVTKQQQLEWLAKAYKTWPEQGSHSLRLSAVEVGKFAIVNAHIITRKEWQQERDKMNDKPEVDDSWFTYCKLPPCGIPIELWFGGSFAYNCEFISMRGNTYVVWNLDADKPDCADSLNSEFRPLRTEWEKMLKQQDNSWYERGELPPVGCECEIKHKCWSGFNHVTVLAITKEYAIVEDDSVVAREQHYHLRDITFRPLCSEREKAIDELIALVGNIEKYPTWRDAIAGIIDAGYRKVKP